MKQMSVEKTYDEIVIRRVNSVNFSFLIFWPLKVGSGENPKNHNKAESSSGILIISNLSKNLI